MGVDFKKVGGFDENVVDILKVGDFDEFDEIAVDILKVGKNG
jgi:hypothetical protein